MQKQFVSVLALWLIQITQLFAQANWTVVSYIQSDNNLYEYALSDIAEMSQVGSSTSLNILVQIDVPANRGTWRYKINKGKVTLDSFLQTEMGSNVVNEIVSTMQWAVGKYPAQNYMLVLSGHGSGVIDPKTRSWIRGVLFDDSQNTYMNNQQLSTAMSKIKSTVLSNKKLDILGMDTCLMAMLEVEYQVKDYVNLFVASQETEDCYGWYYTGFLSELAKTYCSPIQAAGYIVSSYQDFYLNESKDFTLSAVNLANLNSIKQNINTVVSNISACKALNRTQINNFIRTARSKSQDFYEEDYIDLYSFYDELKKQLDTVVKSLEKRPKPKPKPKPTPTPTPTPTQTDYQKKVTTLKNSLEAGKNLIIQTVTANVAGQNVSKAKGLSIYYPVLSIHSSYAKTQFAKDSSWPQFLKENI